MEELKNSCLLKYFDLNSSYFIKNNKNCEKNKWPTD